MKSSNPGITVAFSAVVVELGDEWMISNGEFLKASIDLFTGTDEDGASSLSSLLRMTFMSGAQACIGRMMEEGILPDVEEMELGEIDWKSSPIH